MDKFYPEEHIGRLVVRTRSLLSQRLHQALNAYGFTITPEQWAILIGLWEEDGISQTQLAERAIKDKPTTTRILKLLENQDLVYRQKDATDRRAQQVFLTDKGKKLVKQMIPLAVEVLNKAQLGLTTQEVAELKRMLKVIIANLQ